MKTKILLKKTKSFLEYPHPNGIDVGYERQGIMPTMPIIGKRFVLYPTRGMNTFSTSPVTEIVDETTFKTENGEYTFEYIS